MNDNLRLYRQVFDQLYGASRSLFRTHIHSGSFALHVVLEVHWLAFTTCLCNLYLWTLMLTGPGTELTPPFFLMNSSKNRRLQHLPSTWESAWGIRSRRQTKSTDEWQGP